MVNVYVKIQTENSMKMTYVNVELASMKIMKIMNVNHVLKNVQAVAKVIYVLHAEIQMLHSVMDHVSVKMDI